jgi:predicted dehydrogenase
VLVTGAVSQRTASHNALEVFGSGGSLRLSSYHADSLELATAAGREGGAWRRIRPLVQRASQLPGALRAARGGGDFKESYVRQWRRIVSALADDGAMPASVEDGRQAAAVVAAALHSAAEGSIVVPVPPRAPLRLDTRAG